jgi:hypothetical protein
MRIVEVVGAAGHRPAARLSSPRMQTGYSLLLREYVAAKEVDYGDCEEFQITCPSCHEAIFKAGKYDSDRQYFSHYAASKSDVSDCELRVAALSNEQTARENLIGRGQTLAQFFARFQDILVTWMYSGKTPEWLGASDPLTMKKRLMWSCSRPEFIRYARHVRHHMRHQAAYGYWQIAQSSRPSTHARRRPLRATWRPRPTAAALARRAIESACECRPAARQYDSVQEHLHHVHYCYIGTTTSGGHPRLVFHLLFPARSPSLRAHLDPCRLTSIRYSASIP